MSIGNRIMKTASERSEELHTSARHDLRLVDFAPAGIHNAQVLFQYEGAQPSLRELQAWFNQKFGNKVHAKLETARSYEGQPIMTIFASLVTMSRPLSDAANMSRVGGLDTYMDPQTNSVWDVAEGENGVKYLLARTNDDLNKLFERVKGRGHSRSLTASLLQLREAVCCFDAGDTVKFLDRDLLGRGEIVSIKGDNVTLMANGAKVTVDKGQIVEVVRRNPDAVNEERVKLLDFFSKIYNPEFAEQMTHTMTTDVVGPLKV